MADVSTDIIWEGHIYYVIEDKAVPFPRDKIFRFIRAIHGLQYKQVTSGWGELRFHGPLSNENKQGLKTELFRSSHHSHQQETYFLFVTQPNKCIVTKRYSIILYQGGILGTCRLIKLYPWVPQKTVLETPPHMKPVLTSLGFMLHFMSTIRTSTFGDSVDCYVDAVAWRLSHFHRQWKIRLLRNSRSKQSYRRRS